jgi:hypothetical protein
LEIDRVVKVRLFDLWEDHREEAPTGPDFGDRVIAPTWPGAGDARDEAWGEDAVGRFVTVEGQADLFEMVAALHAARGFAGRLDGGQEQTDHDPDDRDDNEEFDEGETASSGRGLGSDAKGRKGMHGESLRQPNR